nr:hypothetical protein [Tanacetum cinerariifolium]
SLFADTHNVVAILEKSNAAEDDVTRLQALVDKKKIVISEGVICAILQLDDAEGVVCFPNEEIFAGLAQMGYKKPAKRTSWNEFSMAMASAVMTMLLRMLLMMLFHHLHLMTFHLLLKNHLYLLNNHKVHLKLHHRLEIIKLQARVKRLERANKVKSSKLRRLRKAEKQAEIYHLDLDHSFKVLSMQEDDSEVQEVVEVVTTSKLITDVTAASQVSAASATIFAAKPSIPAAAPTVVAAYTRRRKGVIIRDPEEELSSKTRAETPKVKDKGKGVNTPRSDEDRLKLMELMVFLMQKAVVKRSGDVTRLQALVDKKKIVISKDAIREIFRLDDAEGVVCQPNKEIFAGLAQMDDAEGVVCLPNEEIFAGLAQMGYEKPSTKLTFYKAFFSSQWKFFIHTLLQSLSTKRTSWNEFSTAMASAVICLSKGQKFNFSTYIFDSLVRNVDSSSKFYIWVGKGFSGVAAPLFEGMLAARQLAEEGIAEEQVQVDVAVAAAVQDNVAEDVANAAIPSPPSHDISSPSQEQSSPPQQPQRRIESSDDMKDVFNQGRMIDDLNKDEGIELVKDADIAKTEGRHAAEQAKKHAEIYHLDLDHPSKVLSMQEDDSEVQEVVKVVTTAKLIIDVITIASQVSAASATISAAKPSIPAAAPTVVAAYTRRRKGVIIRDLEEELSSKTPAETPKLKDKGKGILVETPKPMKKKDQIEMDAEYARKLHEEINKDHEEINKDIDWDATIDHTESEARKNMMIYLKNTVGYKMGFFKGMSYDEICPIFQARFDENMRFLFKSREEMEEEDQEVLKSINETPAHKATKRRKLNEKAQEAEDIKKRLEVVDDEDDDVFIEATPLARKKISTFKVHTGTIGECNKTSSRRRKWDVIRAAKVHKTTASGISARMMVEHILHKAKDQE